MKIHIQNKKKTTFNKQGFASILMVISVGLALLIILLMVYRNTIQSQKDQSHLLLRNDYLHREDAFLSALTNIIPNKAMRGMMDNTSAEADLNWTSIMQEALTQANANQAMDATTQATLGLDTNRSANTADTTIEATNVIHSVFTEGALISSGTNTAGGNAIDYPDLLLCSSGLHDDDSNAPIISYLKSTAGNTAYELVLAPELSFKYHNDPELIAKHNWWTFDVAFSGQDTGVTNLIRSTKRYLVSLYEMPAQLAINSASFTNFGQHDDGSNWSSNITTVGGVFAGGVKTQGTFTSTDGIASRKGVELADASNPLASDNTARNDALYKGGTATNYSSSSDGGHVAFVPVLPVVPLDLYTTQDNDYDLYQDYLDDLATWENNGSDPATRPKNLLFYTRTVHTTGSVVQNELPSTSAMSTNSTAWKYYSRGANQCQMVLVDDNFYYTEYDALTNTYNALTQKDKGDVGLLVWLADTNNDTVVDDEVWDNTGVPSLDAAGNQKFDLVFETLAYTKTDNTTGTYLNVDMQRLMAFLGTSNIDANDSLCVNVINSVDGIAAANVDFVAFANAKDLRNFKMGDYDVAVTYPAFTQFSLVTNKLLLLDEDINVGNTTATYNAISLSMYAPSARYGTSENGTLKIEVIGALGSLAEKDKDDAVDIIDLKVMNQAVSSNDITATLSSITDLDDLPPVNMMNWMIVIREIHE